MKFSPNTKNTIIMLSSNPNSWRILKKKKTVIQKDTYAPMFTATLFTIAKTCKQPKCPSADE